MSSAGLQPTLKPSQVFTEIVHCISAGLTPLILSSPGLGKSSLVHQVARDYRLKIIDLRLSQCTPEDLQGYPMRNGNKATFTPFDIFPLEGDDIPEGHEGWLLFLDELTSATKPVQAAAYKLILDRMVGSFHLHPNVAIVAAGNKSTDKAVVNQMSTALQSRLVHYELEVSVKDWMDYAIRSGIDYRITGFINYMPSKLMDFRPDHQDKTFACPRTWEFLSRLIKDQEVSFDIAARVAGTIGSGTGVEFITFAQEFDRLPKLRDILSSPANTPVPAENSTKYATISMLIEHFTDDNLDQMIVYLKRFDIEFQVIFCRGAVTKDRTLRDKSKAFSSYIESMTRYLY
ncbi:MAG: ATP-binding protein [Gemmobacter sp.]